MDKIDHKSKDILGGNVEKIAELFPGVITEAKDEATGELKKVVDFDLLRQHLSDELVEGDRERFRLDWPGKKASILKANTPITKTLRPVREDSVDFDTTQNIFIEGDNFEVLKVLQESYLGKIKMIYIDPPYNTGKDFIYKDNFAADKGEYEEEIGVRDDENGGKLVKNTETNGRYHSDWLSMMQERLIVARDLLTDDGVIFISIGDNEQANLTNLCNELFGESNSLGTVVRKSQTGINNKAIYFSPTKDYVLAYGKSPLVEPFSLPVETNHSEYSLTENEDVINKGRKYKRGESIYKTGLRGDRPNSVFGIVCPDGEVVYPPAGKHFKWSKDRFNSEYAPDKGVVRVMFRKTDKSNLVKEDGVKANWNVYEKSYQPETGIVEKTQGDLLTDTSFTNNASVRSLGDMDLDTYFDYMKPLGLIGWLIKISHTDGIVLDFFSGSGTTAHAVMQLNAEDGGNRKHIQVQLAEPTDPGSEAYKAGYKTIPEISRERIRRAAKKIREDYAEQIAKRDTPLDTGFRAYRLSSSNFVDTAQHPAQTTQASLLDTTDNAKDDRTPEDLLTEVILDLGLTLDLPIEHRDIAGHSVCFVGGNSLVACFDDKISLDIVDGIAAENPLRIVFKDSSFANDETRINIDIRLKQLSPDTTVQVV